MLRAAAAAGDRGACDLFRGMKHVAAPGDFLRFGGTELAPMSTTTSLRVAAQYAKSTSSIIFKITTQSFLQRGADLAFLSAFPGEAEFLLPPLTCLRPTGRKQTITFHSEHRHEVEKYTVIEVEPLH